MSKDCLIHSHNFPTFEMKTTKDTIECKSGNSFTRTCDGDNFEEIWKDNSSNPIPKTKLQKQIEEAEKNAFEKGYNQGITDGKICGKQEVEPVLVKFEQALEELQLIRQNMTLLAEKEAVDLSLAIAKKIVGNEISLSKDVITHVVKEALQKVHGHENIRIKLNPEELQVIKGSENELKNIANCVENIEIICDESISPGGCIIETNIGDIDARIEKQLKIVEDAFNMESK